MMRLPEPPEPEPLRLPPEMGSGWCDVVVVVALTAGCSLIAAGAVLMLLRLFGDGT